MFERNSLGKSARVTKLQYSSNTLKFIGLMLVMVGTVGSAILSNILGIDEYSTSTLLDALISDDKIMTLTTWIVMCMGVCNLAIPIYAFLTIQGYKRTSSRKKYVFKVALLALVTELPYNFAISGNLLYNKSQNPVFGILLILIMLYFLDYFEKINKIKGILLKILIVVVTMLWARLFNVEKGLVLVLVTAVLWIFEGGGGLTTFLAVIASLFQFPAPIGLLFNHFYNGEKGKVNRIWYYIAVPVQYLILGIIGKYII